ncbi:MAG: hypothetical protein EXR77_06485 [Myxococcales bacterium]|nr:hypothetical protein [Myxococcales bacterium]
MSRPPVAKNRNSRANDPVICCCNAVPLSEIERAIGQGACTLAQLFDATFAGCGPCGGSCQPELVQILARHRAQSERTAKP